MLSLVYAQKQTNKQKNDFLLAIPREGIRGGWKQRSSCKNHLHYPSPQKKSTWKFAVEGCIFKKSQTSIQWYFQLNFFLPLIRTYYRHLSCYQLLHFLIPEFLLSVSQKSLTTTDSKVDQDLQKEALWLNLSSRDYGKSTPSLESMLSRGRADSVDFLTQRLRELYHQQAVFSH